jgi:hypothetical protein
MADAGVTSTDEVDRFEMFVAVLGDVASMIDANDIDEPALRAPSDLLDYIADELTNRSPFKSRANCDFVLREVRRIRAEDPLIAADAALNQAFSDLEIAIIQHCCRTQMCVHKPPARFLRPH